MDRARVLSAHQNVHVSRQTRPLKLLHTSLPLKSRAMWGSDANSRLSLSTHPTILTFFCAMCTSAARMNLYPCRPPHTPFLQSPSAYEQWVLLWFDQFCVEWTTCLTLVRLRRLR